MMLGPITWTCHICGAERPDAQISVHTRDVSTEVAPYLPDGTITEHVRYCNDRPECALAARTHRHLPILP